MWKKDDRLVIPNKLLGPLTPSDVRPGTAVTRSFDRTSDGELRLVFRPVSTP